MPPPAAPQTDSQILSRLCSAAADAARADSLEAAALACVRALVDSGLAPAAKIEIAADPPLVVVWPPDGQVGGPATASSRGRKSDSTREEPRQTVSGAPVCKPAGFSLECGSAPP